ncbi:DeoR family transcriptional regulator [Serratia odorifera]|uniref:Transcriptional regulator, DeoR family n=2 Tax=Serratia odorifera TaxID=618 RepID=D4E469_SEROD|nr:DeoR family transcriptional regulator [Serratia odorifera]EFE95278.1 transcriptional regulator, DeoR family [Serratia odorifera DSM 4582]PNK90103.1 DeoR family transcriptional regulator [Serratia odorifera]RII71023.1 DeoR family transcriptional regulator [Serratia odorifera]HEJ9094371.1 DeoR family transcriptional regulator [Serratia odorifera]
MSMSDKKSVRGTSERREKIISLLKQQGAVQVSELAAQFNVSTVTIRGDLAFLEKRGIATRAYGGALICEPPVMASERSIEAKQTEHLAVKQRIARKAAEMVVTGSSIILDSGTTTYEIAQQLRDKKEIIVMTNGMNVANALLDATEVELLVTGGHLRRSSQSFYGSQAELSLDNYHFDMLFLGVDGLSLSQGVTTHQENEARLNRRMCEVSKRIIAVADSSKFNRVGLHRIIDTARIDVLITDTAISDEMRRGLEALGVELLLVEHD